MSSVERQLTLPDLQRQLDRLRAGERLTIGGPTYHRLFGQDDVARTRLRNFATGHRCTANQFNHAVTFQKTS